MEYDLLILLFAEKELEDALAKWLANSRDRDGGKKERTLREAADKN